MKVPRQARLESAVLLALRESGAASVAELARRVGASRPSTSRAFTALARKGLAQTDGRHRSLTDEGRQAADDLLEPSAVVRRAVETEQRQIRTMVERAQVKHLLGNTAMFDTFRILERDIAAINKLATGPAATIRLAAAAPITDMVRTIRPEIAAVKRLGRLELDALQTVKVANIAAALPDAKTRVVIADIAKRFADMPIPKGAFAGLAPGFDQEALKAFAQIGASAVDRDLTDFVAKASLLGRELAAAQAISLGAGVAAAVDSVRLQMDALGPTMLARQEWVSMLTESMSLGSTIVGNVSAISAFAEAPDARTRRRHARLAAAVNPLVVANRDNAAAELGGISTGSPQDRAALFIPPSVTTSKLTGVARLLLDRDEQGSGMELPDPGDLFDILDARGMRAVSRDLRGARDAVARLPDGWAKTVAHLLREAMREVLLVLAPDDQIPNPAAARVTRRMRISYSVGGASATVAVVIDSAAKGWDDMVGFLSAEAHNAGDPRLNRAGMIGGVIAVEGMIRMLIAAHDIGRRSLV